VSSIFDQIVSVPEEPDHRDKSSLTEENGTDQKPPTTESESYTPVALKTAVQELLKCGILESDRKPNLYQTVLTRRKKIDQILEPLDLRLEIDDIRGLSFLVVAEQLFSGETDEWSHPLIRRQRLTLEQSLLVAILRQHYIVHEQEAGIGAGEAKVDVDDLLPQLQLYLGDPGSDAKEQKRLRNLLEKLKGHGIVSEVDAKDQVTIRPLITHLASPESLQSLLHHFKKQATAHEGTDFHQEVTR